MLRRSSPSHDENAPTRRVCVLTEACDVVVHRPSKWGNPYRIGQEGMTRAEVLLLYRTHVLSTPHLAKQLYRLRGKRLGCYCQPSVPCHGDVLAELAELAESPRGLPKTGGFFGRRPR